MSAWYNVAATRVVQSSNSTGLPPRNWHVKNLQYTPMHPLRRDQTGRSPTSAVCASIPKVGVPSVQINHVQKRREREIKEIAQAARKHGLSEADVRSRIQDVEALLPDLAPNLDRMRASDWALLLRDVQRVAVLLISLKAAWPRANVSRIVAQNPKVLLKDAASLEADAAVVRRALSGLENVDSIIEAVPYLLDPPALAQSLANISKWYNTSDPVSMLAKNPKLLLNVEEADIEADPLYGLSLNLSTIDQWDFGKWGQQPQQQQQQAGACPAAAAAATAAGAGAASGGVAGPIAGP